MKKPVVNKTNTETIQFRVILNNRVYGYERFHNGNWQAKYQDKSVDQDSWHRDTFTFGGENLSKVIKNVFTGLFDKNGKEIYDGDIIKFCNKSEYCKKEYWFPIYRIARAPWRFALIHVGGGLSPDSLDFHMMYQSESEVEVIGNIYENPKLIKKK